ncbi:MAG: (2Fe-2S)-binding protein [Deltaproteobacteria bacterium]|nr:(2Fe-2S)-binding protein [Deltaproteobacteria bacterium]MBP7288589.1 (2Fe-2S)-binding protein [Nannocystaceae bacterium]
MTSSDPPVPSRPRSATIIMQPDPPPPPAAARTIAQTAVKLPDNLEAPAPASPNLPATPEPGGPTVTMTIDGETVTVRKGTNVLEAAKLLGKDICHFCYHPGLSIAASCRQCLVEVEKNPKLQPSCQQIVGDGMVVHTQSEVVLEARRALLEFTLKNHPIDCPICDKAGECTLQRHYMDHDHQLTRVDVAKIRKPKHKDIGREIVLDAERCILCSRCIRFCEEIPGTGELTMTNRGDHEILDIAPGHRLDNAYSMNVVDICPVGALTAKDFRFAIRAWELRATPTTCTGCATGCAIELHTKHEHAHRIVPRFDEHVNGHWMCDEGRYTYHALDAEQRIRHARVDGDEVSLGHAIATVAKRLRGPGKKIAAVFSGTATCEANGALAELAELLGADRFVVGRPPGKTDALLRDADKNPNLRGAIAAAGNARHEGELGLELAGRAYDAVLFVDATLELSEVVRKALGSITSVCMADRASNLAQACAIVLPATSWAESLGGIINRQGRLRVLQPAWRPEGDRREAADLIRDIALALGERDLGSSRERSRALAETHDNAELRRLTADPVAARPTLLRFAHSRG